MKTVFLSTVVMAVVILASCAKEIQDPLGKSSNVFEAKNSSLYSPLGNANIRHQSNGDIMIENLGSSGTDGLSISMSQNCSSDFLLKEIDLNLDSSHFAITAYDASGEFISTLGVQYLRKKNIPFYTLNDSTQNNVEIILYDGVNIKYSETLESKAMPWLWRYILMEILKSIEDVHTVQEMHYENNTVTYSTSTTISFNGTDSNGGGYFNTPVGQVYANRLTLVVEDLVEPLGRLEIQTKGLDNFTILDDHFYQCP